MYTSHHNNILTIDVCPIIAAVLSTRHLYLYASLNDIIRHLSVSDPS